MQETELIAKDMIFSMLRKWRAIVIFALICAILGGATVALIRFVDMNDAEQQELWESEYEIAKGAYWAAISELDRQISENERLATQAEFELAHFDNKQIDYEAELTDLEAQIDYYHVLIEDYKAANEQLLRERDQLSYYLTYRKEQNEKSLLMLIDPYHVNVHEVYLRVDSGYEILPEHTYQNIDPTPELLQTYRLLVGQTNFYDQMIKELKLNTEVRYLTEVISVSEYNTNSLCVRVMSDSAAWSKMVAEYVADALVAAHGHVTASIAEHEITEYNTAAYSVVDLEIYAKQQKLIQEAFDYEESIRGVNTSILNNEAEIRALNADIREFGARIDEVNLAIDNLPLDKQAMEAQIRGFRDANYTLRQEQLKLYEKPEPVYEGYTMISVFTAFVKFGVVGGVVGAVVAALCFAFLGLLGGKVLSSGQLCEAMECEFFGVWPRNKKRAFASVDRWIDRLSGSAAADMPYETATNLVLSNVHVSCGGVKKILLCGGADKETIAEVAQAMKAQLTEAEVLCGGTVDSDPSVVRGLAECDAVILVEQLDRSAIHAAAQLKNRAKAMDKPILGVVVH